MGNDAMMATLIGVLGCLAQADSGDRPDGLAGPVLTRSVRPEVDLDQLSTYKAKAYIEQLGREKRLDTLLYLAYSKQPYALDALAVYVSSTDASDAVRLCRCCGPRNGDRRWEHAFHALSAHRSEQVLDYIKQVHRAGDASVRMHCYLLCLRVGWDDLLEQAEADKNDTRVADPSSGQPLSFFANTYRIAFQKPAEVAGER
jgi:hypothetical protein